MWLPLRLVWCVWSANRLRFRASSRASGRAGPLHRRGCHHHCAERAGWGSRPIRGLDACTPLVPAGAALLEVWLRRSGTHDLSSGATMVATFQVTGVPMTNATKAHLSSTRTLTLCAPAAGAIPVGTACRATFRRSWLPGKPRRPRTSLSARSGCRSGLLRRGFGTALLRQNCTRC